MPTLTRFGYQEATLLPQPALEFRPIVKREALTLGNPHATAVVCCLWSVRDKVAKRLEPALYAALGNLYSGERGLDYLVRNLLANPQITDLVVSGSSLNSSYDCLISFFDSGVESGVTLGGRPTWRVIPWRHADTLEGYVGLDIPLEALERLRKRVTVHVVERDDLQSYLASLAEHPRAVLVGPEGREIFEPPAAEARGIAYPNEVSGFTIHADSVPDAWLEILDLILTHGAEVGSSYKERTKEVLNLSVVIAATAPALPTELPSWIGVTPKMAEEYAVTKLIESGHAGEDVNYTYADRARAWFKKPIDQATIETSQGKLEFISQMPVDQVAAVGRKLAKDWDECKSAVISYWDPAYDNDHGGSPCFNQAWFRIRDNTLHATVVIRSNDMFSAWPENALGFRLLQDFVRAHVEAQFRTIYGGDGRKLALGTTTTFSESAHLYAETWDAADEVFDLPEVQKLDSRRQQDPRGSFVIRPMATPEEVGRVFSDKSPTEQADIRRIVEIEHLDPSGTALLLRVGKPRTMRTVLERHVSRVDHALYVGWELAMAEIAGTYPDLFEYVQDVGLRRRE